jgi:hypothetical protein
MRTKAWLGVVLGLGLVFAFGRARAEGEHEQEPAQEPAQEHQTEHPSPGADAEAGVSDDDEDEGEAKYDEWDPDGDGKEDLELKKDYEEAFAGIPKFDDKSAEAEEQALEDRPDATDMQPSMTVDQFRKIVGLAKTVVLGRMEKKMAKSAAKKMAHFSTGIFVFSLAGLLLLGIPLVVAKKYPGRSGVLFKYSALAAVTFFVTVNLFGGVLLGMRTVQAALGTATNPSMAIAAGTFDTLDRNAEEYIVMGKELFAPTLEQLQGNTDEQPSVVILENGQRLIKDAKVFVSIAHMFKKIDFVFKVLPIVLFCVTMLLFGLAIRPTLTEIVKLPMRAAAGEAGVGRETTRRAMRRVWGELLATICTIGVLAVLTIVSGFVLGRIVSPALDALLGYFSRTITYLQFVEGASSGLVFVTLFAVILFLVMNLAALILSMSFFLGKSQKIFQQRFNEGTPLSAHKRFFTWGIPAVLLVQLIPLVYSWIADKALLSIDESLTSGIANAENVPWGKLLLAGPAFLVVGFALVFWAARGMQAIAFLRGYKIK